MIDDEMRELARQWLDTTPRKEMIETLAQMTMAVAALKVLLEDNLIVGHQARDGVRKVLGHLV